VQEALSRGRRTALCLALAALANPTPALELGAPEVFSGIGENLDARIPVRAREGEWFHAKCLSLAPATAAAPFPPDSVVSVERRRAATHLRVRTASPVQEPAIAFGVTSACAGAAVAVGAPVTLLIDPPRVDRGPRAVRPVDTPLSPRTPGPAPAVPAASRQPTAAAASPDPVAKPPARAAESKATSPAAATPAAPAPARAAGDFVLRLSSGDMDLSRTRGFDESSRARLRERLRLLDSDDQVAEMLSMRDNLRRLEARVAELQLKLATMPQSFPAPAPARVEAPAEVPKPSAPPPQASVAPSKAAPAESAPAPSASPTVKVVGALESFEGRLVALGIAILVLLAMLAAWLWSRWRHPPAPDDEPAGGDGPNTVLLEPEEVAPAEPIEIAAPARAEVTSDSALATRLEEDTEALRRRYIEQRFPEIRAGTIVLDDPASIVKGARLFHEDGAMPRAVELLRFAIEDRPAELRPWLALFEIYRLERLAGEYGELAARFGERHGQSDKWAKVRAFGRELDPANPLYREAAVNTLETIGPQAARRAAAAHADPMAENWLDAPMDFENEVLATDLRRSLMARARVEDRDLAPNPMPALRSIEMFSVG
jgi:pilus assembly protein FimV